MTKMRAMWAVRSKSMLCNELIVVSMTTDENPLDALWGIDTYRTVVVPYPYRPQFLNTFQL